MLTELHVEDLGVIASVRLVLGPGMTALTGETGAGKTLLVEAIELLVGGRAEAGLVRPGSKEAVVEGRFVVGDDEVVLTRVVPADGRSRAYVDGRLATAATLAEHGARLVDLHGQHAHQSLLASATQRGALDHFGAVDLGPLQAARQRRRAVEGELAALGGDARARAREADLVRFQVDELTRAALTDPDEDAALEREEDRLAGALAHREAAGAALDALGEDGARDALGTALMALAGRSPFAAHHDRLAGVVSELDDLVHEMRAAAEAIEEDPERLAEVRERRSLLHELRRKYGDSLAEVMAYRDEAAARLHDLERHDERVAELERARTSAEREEAGAAAAVLAARRGAAPALAGAVQQHLTRLAMPKARVEVVVGDPAPGDDVTFLLGANPGEPAAPLARVASGGELARAMLALRLVLTEAPDSLVFDEVDAGIGGEAALAVGRALRDLGARHQVLVVTHLAQVAAFADHHVSVRKRTTRGRTIAEAGPITGDDRTGELARMLSGLPGSSSAREHADELLAGARRPTTRAAGR